MAWCSRCTVQRVIVAGCGLAHWYGVSRLGSSVASAYACITCPHHYFGAAAQYPLRYPIAEHRPARPPARPPAAAFLPYRTLLRLGELSGQCARAAANFTRNSKANEALCPAGCTYIAPDPQDPASYTSCQLSYSTLYGSLFKHFVDTCPGSLAEAYMSCGLSEDDLPPTVSSPTALQQAAACSLKPVNGTGLQNRGCTLVRAAPGDPEGNYCVPRVWSNATVAAAVQLFAKDELEVTTQDLERFLGTCGRDVFFKVRVACADKATRLRMRSVPARACVRKGRCIARNRTSSQAQAVARGPRLGQNRN